MLAAKNRNIIAVSALYHNSENKQRVA